MLFKLASERTVLSHRLLYKSTGIKKGEYMTVEEWLGKDNKLGIDIWNKKYRRNNESFEEWLDRVSGKDEDVKKLIREKKFLFGGRILSKTRKEFIVNILKVTNKKIHPYFLKITKFICNFLEEDG